ncbi:dethiobiotin synthase [Hydrogenophilus thermoluteolus]|uniref:ATP-dependent dethiobiotin synthetase BioD n=1 Tax=Hydrogenophilus thermoluteolus TaxID=297 RepID=A0A2Z6DYL3_HYDTE|nr:dethiobiotin synthase [Hydrogenophilus thermoluteolus]BBD77573.1 dethiobiotin synthase [Hydrogenophilus thermoluteolus]
MTATAYFVTGTDTEIGKTTVTAILLRQAAAEGKRAAGLKPIAAGVEASGANADVAALIAASNVPLPRDVVNPYCFAEPISPHLAAQHEGVTIDFAVIRRAVDTARTQCDLLFVEGVGGFHAPLSETTTVADLAVALNLPVLLVVGMRLGCLNHALLTVEAITARDLLFAGWIANQIDPEMAAFAENLATLQARLSAPCWGVVRYGAHALSHPVTP